MIKTIVTGGTIGNEEILAYEKRSVDRYGAGKVESIEIHVDGDFVDLKYNLYPKHFQRIRRITGYLVGDMDKWNNAKTAEEKDRVKHA